MRASKIIIVFTALLFANGACCQTFEHLTLKNSIGKKVLVNEVFSQSKPNLIIFWKMTDQRSCNNLKETIQVVIDSIGLEKIEVVAVCSGEPGSFALAEPWFKSQGFDLDFYYEINEEFSRQIGIKAPYTIIMHPKLNLVYRNCNYSFGNEAIICSVLQDCLSQTAEK